MLGRGCRARTTRHERRDAQDTSRPDTTGPGVETASTPGVSPRSGTWKPRRGPARPVGPTQEGRNPSAGHEGQEAKASGRKATGIHNRLDRADAHGESRLTWPGELSEERDKGCSSRGKLDAVLGTSKRT